MTLPTTTRAAVLRQLNEPLTIETLRIPALQPGQVLVKIAYSGICQTQLLEARGKKGPDPWLPHAMGHEASGKVLAVGDGVARVKTDDTVVLSWIKGPGANAPGPKYADPSGKPINAGQVATFMEYAVVAENRCTPIAAGFSMKAAALLGCAIPTGAGFVLNQLMARPGQGIAIIGVGGVGLSALMAAKLMDCHPIVAVDVNAEKLEFARGLGATHLVNAAQEDPQAAIKSIAPGGLDLAVECSGVRSAMEAGFRLIRDGGGQFVIAGNLSHSEKIQIDPFDLIKGKQIWGTAGGKSQPEKDIPLYVRLNQDGRFPFERLAHRCFKLEEINQALEILAGGTLGRLMIEF